MTSLTTLEGSLREVYQAPLERLVPNFSGSKIYQASVGWGRIWSWIFSFLEFCTGKDYSKEKFTNAVEKTKLVFREQFNNIKNHAEKYEEYLRCKTQNLHVDESPYYASRCALLSWIKATSPYATRYLLDPAQRQNDPLKIADLFSKEELKDLEKIESLNPLLRLETALQRPVPLQIFHKIGNKQELETREIAFLKKWMNECDEESHITSGEMNRALRTLESIFSNFDLCYLIRALNDFGFKLIQKKDPEHMAWRHALKRGSKLKTKEKEITLGNTLGRKDPEKDSIHIHAIEEDPNKVVWIAVNPMIPWLKEAYRTDEAGIPSAKCYEIDKEGRFAICERLYNALTDIEWQTLHDANFLQETDQDVLTPVGKLLNWCIQKGVTPIQFSPDYLMFNSKGALRFARLCYLQQFSHTTTEDFILKVSKGNPVIYRFLMIASGMLEHNSHRFYSEVVKMALKKDTASLSDIGATYSIVDPKVIDRAEALYKQIGELEFFCKEVIKQNYFIANHEKNIQSQIEQEISTFYSKNVLSGQLWPKMEETIISRTVEKLKLKKIKN